MPAASNTKHSCTYPGCHLAFGKRNHLERHWRTHTQAQEFSCSYCHRKFSRLDSRNRHIQRLHPEDGHRAEQRQPSHYRPPNRQSQLVTNSSEENELDQDVECSQNGSIGSHSRLLEFQQQQSQLQHRYNNDNNINDQDDTDWVPHLDAAEQLNNLRQQASTSIHSPSTYLQDSAMITSPGGTDLVHSSPATSALSHTLQSVHQTPPWNSNNAFIDGILDVDPIMCSLLWRTLEASITEASGYSFIADSTGSHNVNEPTTVRQDQFWSNNTPFKTPALRTNEQSNSSMTNNDGTTEVLEVDHLYNVNDSNRREYSLPQVLQSLAASRQASMSIPNEHQSESPKLGIGSAHMAAQMKNDLYNVMGHIEAPVEPETGLASSCFWLCRQHFLPHSSLTMSGNNKKGSEDVHALVMNLIAIGSLWHRNEMVQKWGADIWKFTLRVVWSRGMRNVQDEVTASALMTILLSGHSYVLMSSDPSVHQLGRRAWLYCHVLRDQCYSKNRFGQEEAGTLNQSIDDQLEHRLSLPEHRLLLRNDASLLQKTWHQWYELETRIRVAWDLCTYDSQQSTWLEMTPSLQADVVRQQTEPANEELYEAKTAKEWLKLYETNIPKRRDASSILNLLQKPFPCSTNFIVWTTSQLASYNVIESIYSSWLMEKANISRTSEYWTDVSSSKTVDLDLIRTMHALANWRIIWSTDLEKRRIKDRYFLLIRWHCIHLSFCLLNVDINEYIREQTIDVSIPNKDCLQIPKKKRASLDQKSMEDLFNSQRGRRALWHAGQISAKLALLSRGSTTPIHVAQAAFESTLLLVAFSLVCKKGRQTRSSNKSFELINSDDKLDQFDQWADVGLAGFLSLDAQESSNYEAVLQDWGGKGVSSARRWIMEGDTSDALVADLSIGACSMALENISRLLDEGRFCWCLAKDSKQLIDRGISLL
jgi:hypothetical protein